MHLTVSSVRWLGKDMEIFFSNSRPWLTISRPWLTNSRPWLTNSRPWLYTNSRPWLTNSRPWLTITMSFPSHRKMFTWLQRYKLWRNRANCYQPVKWTIEVIFSPSRNFERILPRVALWAKLSPAKSRHRGLWKMRTLAILILVHCSLIASQKDPREREKRVREFQRTNWNNNFWTLGSFSRKHEKIRPLIAMRGSFIWWRCHVVPGGAPVPFYFPGGALPFKKKIIGNLWYQLHQGAT
jgi:hypothetical protein